MRFRGTPPAQQGSDAGHILGRSDVNQVRMYARRGTIRTSARRQRAQWRISRSNTTYRIINLIPGQLRLQARQQLNP
jgi:hypothetical protein